MDYDAFISYDRRDQDPVEEIASGLKDRGLSVFLDRWYLVPGKPWTQALQNALDQCGSVAVIVGGKQLGDWQEREAYLAMDKQARDEGFRVIPVLLPGAESPLGFLRLNTWIDMDEFSGGEAAALDLLALAIRGEPPGPEIVERMTAVKASVSPYRGLRPFREEDAPFFFGREKFVQRLVEVVSNEPVVAVVGPSGSGKSSVVTAGLMPALRAKADGRVWDAMHVIPGRYPMSALATALLPKLEPEMGATSRIREIPRLAEGLRQGDVALADVVRGIIEQQPGTDRLLIVVDQWEELYTVADDSSEAEQFVESVLAASADGPLTLVLTMRGDFFGRAIANRTLSDRLQDAVVNLSAMTREELERAIVEPAAQVGLSFEEGLPERILDAVGQEPGNLPLLEFVLDQLWERKSGARLTHDSYDRIGGLQGAIAQRAEETIAPEHREVARKVFLHLVEPGVDAADTRRRAFLSDMTPEAEPLVRSLVDARLLVSDWDEATGGETIEVSHEALLHSWDRLRNWIAEDREFLVWLSRLRSAHASWERENKDDGMLLRGGPLGEAERWVVERESDLAEDEVAFIAQSRKADRRSRRRVMLILAAGLAFFALLAAGASWYAFDQRDQVIAAAGELNDLNETIDQQRQTVASADARIAEARESEEQARNEAAAARTEAEEAQGNLDDVTQQLGETTTDLAAALDAVDNAEANLEDLRNTLDERCENLRASDLYSNDQAFAEDVDAVCGIVRFLDFAVLLNDELIFDRGLVVTPP